MRKKLWIALLLIFVILQAFRPEKNISKDLSANDVSKKLQVPDSVMNVLKVSCYDCHSNNTHYYWYHEVMPLGWWLHHHIDEGKEHLNFSEFSYADKKKLDHELEEIAEEVEEHEMPLESYTYLHNDASLSPEEIQSLLEWVRIERAKLNTP